MLQYVLYHEYFVILLHLSGKEDMTSTACGFGVITPRFLFRAMAKAPRSLEEILSCQVCYEEFEEDGDRVPRILPCSHPCATPVLVS